MGWAWGGLERGVKVKCLPVWLMVRKYKIDAKAFFHTLA